MGSKPDATVASVADSPALTPTIASRGTPEGSAETIDAGTGVAPGESHALPEVEHDRYAYGSEIGRGGIGRVIKAEDTILNRTIAIKELHAHDEATRKRFVREAMITARLQHPSIVPVYEAGRRNGAPFYAMKLVAGRTLGAAIDEAGTLAKRLALIPSMLAIADAIAYAHRERIVHRDLKPQNVLLGDFGETVVIDWGLAKDLAGSETDLGTSAGPFRARDRDVDRTIDGAVLGTPAYMSPEQAAGKRVDERTDVYAIGAMLYHVIAGTPPHEGDTLETMIEHIVRGDITPIAEREPHAPLDLATIVGKAMSRDAGDRYPSARELADDLRRFQTGQLVAAHHYSVGERFTRWLRRYRAVIAAGAIATAILLVYGIWSVRRIVKEHARAESEAALAIAGRRAAAESHNRAVLAQANSALERGDPAEALAWLGQLDREGPGWQSARALGLGALARHLPDRVVPALSRDSQLDVVGPIAVAWSTRRLWVGNLDTQSSHTFDITNAIAPTPCDDQTRVVGFGTVDGRQAFFTIDTGTYAITTEPIGKAESIERRAGCSALLRFFRRDDAIFVWDRGKARKIGPAGDERGLWTTADGKHALAVDVDGRFTRWHLDGTTDRMHGEFSTGNRMGSSADGRMMVIARDSDAELQDIVTGGRTRIDVPAKRVAMAPDASWVALAHEGKIRIVVAGKVVRTILGPADLTDLAVSPDGKWLLAKGKELTVWNVEQPIGQEMRGHGGVVTAMFASNTHVVSMDVGGRIRRWPIATVERVLDGPVIAAARTPNGAYTVTAVPGTLRREHRGVVETVADDPTPHLEPLRLAIDPSGAVLVAHPDGVWRWPVGGTKLESLGMHDGIVVFPEGVHVAWSRGRPVSWNGESLIVWEPTPKRLAVQRIEGAFGGDNKIARLVISPDGRWAAAGQLATHTGHRRTIVFDLQEMATYPLPDSQCDQAAFTPDSTTVVTGNIEGNVVAWDLATRTPRVIASADQRATVAAISADGKRVAVAGSGDIVIAALAGGDARIVKAPYEKAVRVIAWTTAGDTIAVGTPDELQFHDLESDYNWTVSSAPVSIDVLGDTVIVVSSRLERRFAAATIPRDPTAVLSWLETIPFRLDARGLTTVK